MDSLKILPAEEGAVVEDITTADGIFIKRSVILKKGTWVGQHAHVWDHTTLLTNGEMIVWKDGVRDRRYKAPVSLFIARGVMHRFLTTEDNTTFYCIHNLKGAQAVEILAEHDLLEEVS